MPKRPQRETLAQLEEWQRQLDHASKKACGSMIVIPRLLNHAFWAQQRIEELEAQLKLKDAMFRLAEAQKNTLKIKLEKIHEMSEW